jgi:DNA polymerase I-like protein with 3'-5' exonuclease and polymerase domains
MSAHTSFHDYTIWPYTIVDVETGVHNKGEGAIGSMQASPFHPDNTIVFGGAKHSYSADGPNVFHGDRYLEGLAESLVSNSIIVGHNIKFDLLYFFKRYNGSTEIFNWLLNNILIWDTMVVEYLITGQQEKFSSLDSLAKKYGGTVKDSNIKKYWEDGVNTEDIPGDELTKYLEEDLKNTEIIYLRQKDIVENMPGMLSLIYLEMESLKDTILAEWAGMHVDLNILAEHAQSIHEELNDTESMLKTIEPSINWSSPVQLQAFLFGGTVKVGFEYIVTEEKYKTGLRKGTHKLKKIPHEPTFPGFLLPIDPDNNSLITSRDTSDENLTYLAELIFKLNIGWSPEWANQLAVISYLKMYRKLYKDFNTYYAGISKLVWPNDSCVHANFNHTATDTGRLSCSSPNLQNITSAE